MNIGTRGRTHVSHVTRIAKFASYQAHLALVVTPLIFLVYQLALLAVPRASGEIKVIGNARAVSPHVLPAQVKKIFHLNNFFR